MATFIGEPPWKEACAAFFAASLVGIGRGAKHDVLGQLGGLFVAVVFFGQGLVDHLRHRRLPHQLGQRPAAEVRHAVDDLRQVGADLHGADLALQAFELLLRDAHQLELLRQRRLEVLAAARQRALDEVDQVLGGLGHLDAGPLERLDLALVGAEAAFADDGPGVAHPRAAGKDVLRADAGDPGDDRLRDNFVSWM